MKHTLKFSLITFVSFGVYFVLDALYFKNIRNWFFELTNHFGTSHIITYAISGIPLYLATFLICRKTSIFENLGLNKSISKGFVFSAICTLPMFLGFSIVFNVNTEISVNTILISVLAAGVFEELFFRGFLFGLLFKNTKLGFIPSVFFGALLFGLLHLYQSTELSELVGVFLITFLGGILFAWVYVEWNYNIWVPMCLHMMMNLSWELFSVSDNALGGLYSNLFRVITVALIIILTITFKKKKRMKLEINKNAIWIKKLSATAYKINS